MEFYFILEISEDAAIIVPDYETSLAFLYKDDAANSDKTEFFKIDSETGKIIENPLEKLTLSRTECKVYPPVTYDKFDIESWIGICGELTAELPQQKTT